MFGLSKLALLGGLVSSVFVAAAPTTSSHKEIQARDSSFWLANIKHQGTVAYGNSDNYTVFRNVMDYGAKGDGTTDDTAAINSAITDGNRCGQGCDSTTITPAIIYFPGGTYVVSSPLQQSYYTSMFGDPTDMPTLKASAGFSGMAVIDSDPYAAGGVNWFTNQNNFFRQVRNFVIDLTAMPPTAGAGIHWQVAQATSLQNIVFNMVKGGSGNVQVGIFMDNGSGGFMTDLVFNGGQYGAFFGNQQFTTRNLTFNGCQTAIFMNWNWIWYV
jgi:glucan 1,3-beta-glucosidase